MKGLQSALYLAVQAHTGHVCRLDVFLEVSVVLGEFPGGNKHKVNLAHRNEACMKQPIRRLEFWGVCQSVSELLTGVRN